VNVSSEIAEWAKGRPLWQQDALRRLVTQGVIDSAGVRQLADIVLASHGLIAADDPGRPLGEADLPVSQRSAREATIRAVSDVQDVNDLAEKQNLTFGSPGLTVIYGDNGAGKSGYVRILKKACRARGADAPLLSNVFEAKDEYAPSARVEYAFGGADASFEWAPDAITPDELSLVSVFDSLAAVVYVDREQNIAYAPFGLDLLPKLADVCTQVRDILEHARNAERSQLERLPGHLAETRAGHWLAQLSPSTGADDIARNTEFSLADAERRDHLKRVLAEPDPSVRAREVEARVRRYERLRDRLRRGNDNLKSLPLDDLRRSHSTLRTALSMAVRARGSFPADIARVIDDERFIELWKAGDTAAHARGHAGLQDTDVCPLCHQPLADSVRQWFVEINEYYAKAGVEAARATFAQQRTLAKQLAESTDREEETIDDLRVEDSSLADTLAAHVAARAALGEKLDQLTENESFPACEKPDSFDLEMVTSLIEKLRAEEADLRAATDPEEKAAFEGELLELHGREWLHEQKTSIEEEVARRDRVRRLNDGIRETDTHGITRTATELTRRYVTDELRKRFIEELRGISGDPPRVELVARPGERGAGYYRLQLANAQPGARVAGVVSEGEFRAITLAAFLSELLTEESRSAVVFDDPVSSLDTRNKDRVAARLVALATERQVVVFTHDIPCVIALSEAATAKGIPVHARVLQRLPVGAGVVVEDVPWEAKKFSALIRSLRNGCQRARSMADPLAYADAVKALCGDFRKTLEKAIEEVLLSDVIARFRHPLHTQNVHHLAHIQDGDVATLERLLDKYSAQLHLQPSAAVAPLPGLDEIEGDVQAIDDWARSFRNKTGR